MDVYGCLADARRPFTGRADLVIQQHLCNTWAPAPVHQSISGSSPSVVTSLQWLLVCLRTGLLSDISRVFHFCFDDFALMIFTALFGSQSEKLELKGHREMSIQHEHCPATQMLVVWVLWCLKAWDNRRIRVFMRSSPLVNSNHNKS